MGTIAKTVQQHMESFRLKPMRFDESMQPGWGDAVNYFHQRDILYGTAKLMVPVVVKHQTRTTAATLSPTTCGEHMQTLDVVSGQLHMAAVTSQPESSQMRLGSEKPQSHKFIRVILPGAHLEWTPIQDTKLVQPVTLYPSMKHLKLITI
jgi:hypothetical protein